MSDGRYFCPPVSAAVAATAVVVDEVDDVVVVWSNL